LQTGQKAAFGWKESWKEEPKTGVNDMIQEFLLTNRFWYELHRKIYANKAQISEEEIYQAEKTIGIDFKQGIPEKKPESNP